MLDEQNNLLADVTIAEPFVNRKKPPVALTSGIVSKAKVDTLINLVEDLTGSAGDLGLLAFTGIDPIIPISGLGSIVTGLGLLILVKPRRRYKMKHAITKKGSI